MRLSGIIKGFILTTFMFTFTQLQLVLSEFAHLGVLVTRVLHYVFNKFKHSTEVRINLRFWLRRDLNEDQSRAE